MCCVLLVHSNGWQGNAADKAKHAAGEAKHAADEAKHAADQAKHAATSTLDL